MQMGGGHGANSLQPQVGADNLLYLLLALVIYLVIIGLIGVYLWNEILVKSVTVLRPLTSVWELIGIVLLFHIIYPSVVLA